MYSTYNKGKSVAAESSWNTMEILIKIPKFKVGDRVRISKYKITFAKGYIQNWSEEVFIITKIKGTVPWVYVISDLNGEPIAGSFYEKELQKTSQEIFRIDKIIKRQGDEFYIGLIKKTSYKDDSILS